MQPLTSRLNLASFFFLGNLQRHVRAYAVHILFSVSLSSSLFLSPSGVAGAQYVKADRRDATAFTKCLDTLTQKEAVRSDWEQSGQVVGLGIRLRATGPCRLAFEILKGRCRLVFYSAV